MDTKTTIKKKIRNEFGNVEFPHHCGINAAIAKDDWINDPIELKKITKSRDVCGHWWDIPREEFKFISLASSYFDPKNTEFYLPAFLSIVLDEATYANCNTLVSWLDPNEDCKEIDLQDYFLSQFSNITGGQKMVCMDVIKYIYNNYPIKEWHMDEEIDYLLKTKFWQN